MFYIINSIVGVIFVVIIISNYTKIGKLQLHFMCAHYVGIKYKICFNNER